MKLRSSVSSLIGESGLRFKPMASDVHQPSPDAERQPSWPLASMLPIAAISLAGQVQSRSSSRVPPPGNSTAAVGLRSQTALTGSDRPWTIPQREHGHPAAELPVTAVGQRRPESPLPFAPADRRWRRRSGSASGSEGVRVNGGASGPAGRLETVQKVLTRGPGQPWAALGRPLRCLVQAVA
jgi:hypothetical protein